MPSNCCDIIKITGSEFHYINQLYIQNSKSVNGRLYFASLDNDHGIWFDKTGHWIVGTLSDINLNPSFDQIISNTKYDDCPADTQMWNEAEVQCSGKY